VLTYYALVFAISWGGFSGGRSWHPRRHQLANRSAVRDRGPGDACRPPVAGILLTVLVSERMACVSCSRGCSRGGWVLSGTLPFWSPALAGGGTLCAIAVLP